MKLFAPESPFLKSVDTVIQSEGGPAESVIRSGGRERLFISWFPDLPNGLLIYDSDQAAWEQDENERKGENLMLRISDDGCLEIVPGDDDPVWIETTLKAGDELNEVLEFYTTASAKQIGTSSSTQKLLSQVISNTFLLIPQKEGHPRLLPLHGHELSKKHPEVTIMLDAWFTKDWDTIIEKGGRPNFGEWLDEVGMRETLGNTEELRHGDLILTGSGEVHYAGMLMADAESDLGFAPAVVLRPSADASCMWLVDYLEHATEAEGLIEDICGGWKQLPKKLTKISVTIPSAKRDRVAEAIERRSARVRYMRFLEAAMKLREPFSEVTKTYQKRTRAAQGLHTELLDELVAVQHPLPFFLEYPYRVYRRETDHVRRVRAGQRLLGMLAKVPLYLVVEELLSICHPAGLEILNELKKAPPSDGTLVTLHRGITAKLVQGDESPLILFKRMPEFLEANGQLMQIVSARNRMHHEPFDELGFLRALDTGAPALMDSLRKVLEDCLFLVPSHTQMRDANKLLVAENVNSADALFRVTEKIVSLPLESFPSGKLIVFRDSPECVLALNHLFTTRMVSSQSRDIGIYDRMDGEMPHFVYLRSD